MKRKGPQRDVAKERFWRGVIRQQRQSGQSIREYCRENALSEPSFYAWRQELQRRSRVPSGWRTSAVAGRHAQEAARKAQRRAVDTATFVPVRLAAEVLPSPDLAAIELALPSGALLRWPVSTEPAAIVALLSAWERARC